MIPYTRANLGTSNGAAPLMFEPMNGGNERALTRKYLTRAFGNMNNSGLTTSPLLYNKNILGPFRTAFNAGDVITNNIEDTNSIYGIMPNQVGGNNLSRLQRKGDGKSGQKGNAMYSGNTKFVHAGSDYIRFKKLQALNQTYDDKKFGGAENNQATAALYRVRK
jgi:hypothetical protein